MSERQFAYDFDQNALDEHLKELSAPDRMKFLTTLFADIFANLEGMTPGDLNDLENLLADYKNQIATAQMAKFSECLKLTKIKTGTFTEPGKPYNERLLVTYREGSKHGKKNGGSKTILPNSKNFSAWSS
jgi:hypothetical protein